MYTQCPQCQTVYSVTIETLRQAGGQVECGQCGLRFNALPRLSETFPAGQPDLSQQQQGTGVDAPLAESGAESVPEADLGTDAGDTPGMEQALFQDEPQAHEAEQQLSRDEPYAEQAEPESSQDESQAHEAEQELYRDEQHAPHPGSEPDEHRPESTADQGDAHAVTRSVDDSAEAEPDEAHEYDTWLRHLDREWDPTQTGTQDAWSRAAPQVDPPPDAAESGTVPNLAEDTDTDDEAGRTAGEDEPAEEPEGAPALDSSREHRGLDTGISYIESWAEDLLAEAERGEDSTPEAAVDETEPDTTSAPAPPDAATAYELETHPGPDVAADHEPAAIPEDPSDATPPSVQQGALTLEEIQAPATADASADQPTASIEAGPPAGDEADFSGPGPSSVDESGPVAAEPGEPADTTAEQTDTSSRDNARPEPGDDDKWLEETWATDTQSFQPEIWLEPDFVDQDALPEKLEGAAGESGEDDHAATDPAIQTEADRKKAVSDEIAGLWPELDGDAEVEEIVLESAEPGAPIVPESTKSDSEESSGAIAGDAGRVIALAEPAPTHEDPAVSAAEAAAVAAAGKVQAAAVKVTTGVQTEDQDAWPEGDDSTALASRAEEVAIELGLPHRRPWFKWAIRLTIALVLLALIATGIHSQHGVLMRNASIAPVLERAYGIIGITVQPTWDIAAFDILDSSARSSDNDLIVMASFTNRAEFAQPYPVLRVTLENRWGQAIGQEDFSPRNYLRAYVAGRNMDAGERARAEVILRSPGAAAEGFSVDLCLESVNGSFRCLADRP